MTEGRPESQKQGKGRKALGVGCFGLLLVASALGVTAFYLLTAVPPPDRGSRVLPDPNGYDAVKAAVQRLTPSLQGSPILKKGATAGELRKALGSDLPVLEHLHDALKLPYVSPPIEMGSAEYSAIAMNLNAQIREGARKLAGKCRLAKAEGRYPEAMETALDGIALGVKMARGGTIIDALVGSACIATTGTDALSLVEHLDVPELRPSRVRVEGLLSQAVSEKDILEQERRLMLQDAHRGRFSLQNRLMHRQMDQVYKEALREAEKPSVERQPPASATSMFGRLVAPVIPDLRRTLDKRDRLLATLRIRLAVEEYRKTHQRLPQGIDDLIPEILSEAPLDPPTQKALKYRRIGSAYEIAPP